MKQKENQRTQGRGGGAAGGGGREDVPPHGVQRCTEVLPAKCVSLPQQNTLLQRHRHGCTVLGTLTAGETHTVYRAAHLDENAHKHTYTLNCVL